MDVHTRRESLKKKKTPIIFFFPDNFGSRSPVIQKTLQTKTATSIVTRVFFQPWGALKPQHVSICKKNDGQGGELHLTTGYHSSSMHAHRSCPARD